MAVSKRLRYEILKRDNHACRYCGGSAPDVKLTVDHVVPVALGGTDDPSNLVAACVDCNAGKSSVPPDAPLVDDVAADAIRWASAMDRAAEIDRQQRSSDDYFVAEFIDRMVTAYESGTGYELPSLEVIKDRRGVSRTLLQFRDNRLNLDDLEYAIRTAMGNKRIRERDIWRYFCGVCWRLIEERQDKARSLLEAEECG